MTSIFTVMNDEEARTRVQESDLSEQEQRFHLMFIEHFAGSRFFANTPEFVESFQEDEDVTLPSWTIAHLTALSGAFPAEGTLHFAFDSFMADSLSPLTEELDHLWFSLEYNGWPSNKRQKKVLKSAGENISLFPIGAELQDDGYQLAINVAVQDDTRIYQYHINSVMANDKNADPTMASVFPIFSSPGEMLSKVKAIRHGKNITESKI